MEKATNLIELMRVCNPYPLEKENFDKFHVETSEARGQNSASRLSDYFEINRSTPQKVLFMGHRGSGKTTELWQVRKYLEPTFHVISFSIRNETDIMNLKYMDLIFIIMKNLLDQVKVLNIKINESLLDNLIDYWSNEKILEKLKTEKSELSAMAEAKIGFLTQLTLGIKGILSTGRETKEIIRNHIEPILSYLIDSIQDIIGEVKSELHKQSKVPIIIIEDLDKLEIPIAEDLFLRHRNVLTALDIHMIYTFPIFLHYDPKFNEIKDSFSHYELLSMIKINLIDGTSYQKGRDILKKIVEARADINLFEPDVLDFIIDKTGGVLRNIFELIKSATLTERSKNRLASAVGIASVKEAYSNFKSDFERKLSEPYLEPLKKLYYDTNKKPLSDDVLKELLYSTAIIEYNGERWCDLHPVVKDILKERGIISAS